MSEADIRSVLENIKVSRATKRAWYDLEEKMILTWTKAFTSKFEYFEMKYSVNAEISNNSIIK